MIDYCKQFFGKSLLDLTYTDIELFFEEDREESNILEFKSGQFNTQDFDNILNKKIIRAITSFLNSEGGLLIWGSPKEKEKEKGGKKVKVAAGPLCPNVVFNEKDQLINKITRSISYMPTGITMTTLEFGGQYIYIFEIQESQSKPHQYADQYPIRIDGQTLPAPHYLVDSMFKMVKVPELDGRIKFHNIEFAAGNYIKIGISVVIYNKTAIINEKNLSFQLVVSPGIILSNSKSTYFSRTHNVLHYGRPYLEEHTIYISQEMFAKKPDVLDVILSFGGELGQALTSKYKINPRIFRTGIFDFKKYIIYSVENENFKKTTEALGVTHEESVNIFMKKKSKRN